MVFMEEIVVADSARGKSTRNEALETMLDDVRVSAKGVYSGVKIYYENEGSCKNDSECATMG